MCGLYFGDDSIPFASVEEQTTERAPQPRWTASTLKHTSVDIQDIVRCRSYDWFCSNWEYLVFEIWSAITSVCKPYLMASLPDSCLDCSWSAAFPFLPRNWLWLPWRRSSGRVSGNLAPEREGIRLEWKPFEFGVSCSCVTTIKVSQFTVQYYPIFLLRSLYCLLSDTFLASRWLGSRKSFGLIIIRWNE